MEKSKKIKFKIEHLDPRGQGVSKETDKISFVWGSLPGEEGEAELIHSKKKINFSIASKINVPSESRIEPTCPHFLSCGGCHFLHSTYEKEISSKKESLKFLSRSFFSGEIQIIRASQRDQYRNRVQLHYDLDQKKIGLRSLRDREIIEIPDCVVNLPQIKEEIDQIYKNNSWINLVKNQIRQGHIEIYHSDNQNHIAINQDYAHLGFSQINSEMNIKLTNLVQSKIDKTDPSLIYDLFGGDGNLTKNTSIPSYVIDSFRPKIKFPKHQTFIKSNLYSKHALKNLKLEKNDNSLIILDPPRSGLKNILDFVDHLDSKNIIYVSCDPHSLSRDALSIKSKYQLTELYLLDLFPSTYHFESIAIFKKTL